MSEFVGGSQPQLCYDGVNPPEIPRNTSIIVETALNLPPAEVAQMQELDPKFNTPFIESETIILESTQKVVGTYTLEWRLDQIYNAEPIPLPPTYPYCTSQLGEWQLATGYGSFILKVQFTITNELPEGGNILVTTPTNQIQSEFHIAPMDIQPIPLAPILLIGGVLLAYFLFRGS